jgi:hypothetical protein
MDKVEDGLNFDSFQGNFRIATEAGFLAKFKRNQGNGTYRSGLITEYRLPYLYFMPSRTTYIDG